MKKRSGLAILLGLFLAPVSLRAEITYEQVQIQYGSRGILHLIGDSVDRSDYVFESIQYGELFSEPTGFVIDETLGTISANVGARVDFGGTVPWHSVASYSMEYQVSTLNSTNFSAGGLFHYAFKSNTPGTIFIRYVDRVFDFVLERGIIDFYNAQLGWGPTYGPSGNVVTLAFAFDPNPSVIDQNHVLRVVFPAVSFSIGQGQLEGESDAAFIWGFDALPGSSPDVPLLPSSTTDDGGFVIDVITEGTIGDVVYIDPAMAIGYNYESESIHFRSVLIPNALPGGDDTFDLLFGTNALTLTAGIEFDFTSLIPEGVSEFSIRGINPDEMLDPSDPTAFVTGLTFMESGFTEVTMTPISVPEASSFALATTAVGLLLAASQMRPRKIRD